MASGELTQGLQETLAIFETNGEEGEPLTTSEVTDELDVSRRSTYDRLEKLADLGHLNTKKAGAKGRIWWKPVERQAASDRPSDGIMDDLASVVYRCRNEEGWPMEYVSDGCHHLTGYDSADLESGDVSWGRDVVHPDDVYHVRDSVETGLEADGQFSIQYRIRTADDETRWVWERGCSTDDVVDGGPLLEGLITDVTELKRQARHLEHEIDEVFERVDDAFYAVDRLFRFTYVNERAEELLQHDEDELLGERVWDVFPEAAETDAWDAFHEALETQEPTSYELYFDALGFWVEANVYPSETGLSVYFRDVTERKQRERELERYETLFMESEDVNTVLNPDGTFQYLPPSTENVLGYEPEELLGESTFEYVHPDDRGRVKEEFQTLVAEPDYEPTVEFRYQHADGHWVVLEAHGVNLLDDPDIEGIVAYSRDVTERTEMERELRESERRYRALVENFPNGAVALVTEDLTYRTVGGSPTDVAGVTAENVEGKPVREALPPTLADELVPRYEAAFEGESSTFEAEYNGRSFTFQIVPIRDNDGEVFAALGMSQDITERKERERYLEDAKSQLEAATEAGAVGTWEWDVQKDEMRTGAAFARIFGVDPDEARRGVSLDRFVSAIHEDDRDRVEAAIEAAVESCGEYEEEYRVWNADGDLRWVVARGHVECNEDGEPVLFPGALTDITERKHAELELQRNKNQLETLFEVLPAGVIVADTDGRLVEANETAKEIWGGDVFDADSVAEYEKYPIWWADSGERVAPEEMTLARVLDGEEVTDADVFEIEAFDGERRVIQVEGMPIRDDDGEVIRAVVTLNDVTERRRAQRRLEESERRYRTIVENFPNGAVALFDEEFRYTTAGGTISEQLDVTADEIVGQTIWDRYPEELVETLEPNFRAALDGEQNSFEFELNDRHWLAYTVPVEDDDGEVFAGMMMAQDVTERKEREAELERTLDLLEKTQRIADVGGWEIDPEAMDVFWTDHMFELLGVDADEEPPLEEAIAMYHEEDQSGIENALETAIEGAEPFETEVRIQTGDDEWRWLRLQGAPETDDGDVVSIRGAAQDITDRKRRELELEQYETAAETVSDVIVTIDTNSVIQDINPAVADMFGYEPEEMVGDRLTTLMPEELAGDHLDALEQYLTTGARHIDWDYVELPGVRADGTEIPLAVSFSEYEYGGERFFAGILRDISERKERERELVQQREQLSALNSINEVVRDITDAVVEQSTREEIEATVCERLAEADSYRFAWIGEVDRPTGSVDVRAEAGAEDYLDEVTITVDPEDPKGQGPTGIALRTGETQTLTHIKEDPDYEPWREYAKAHDVHSSAAIPITHEGSVYGVLNVYADRPNAFENQEQAVISQLGEVIGHAIASVDRKRALMGDEVVELQFRIPDVFDVYDTGATGEGRITLDQVVPVSEDEYLVYGTATADAVGDVSALVASVTHWEDVTFHDESGETTFELRLTDPPVFSTLASLGGSVKQVVIEDGNYDMTVQLSPNADTRQLIEAVQEAYPVAEMMTRRQVTRSDETAEGVDRSLVENLTDRQLTALRAAYHAGFFEWPRDTSGEDLATSLGVSAPTFHQHLRKAEKKVFDSLLDDAAAERTAGD